MRFRLDESNESERRIDIEAPDIHKRENEFELDGIHYHTEDLSEAFKRIFGPSDGRGQIDAQEKLRDYIQQLDESTPERVEDSIGNQHPEYSEEELKDIWDNDPGYINIRAMRRFDGEKINLEDSDDSRRIIDKDSGYMEFGFHRRGLENWNKEEFIADETLDPNYRMQPGQILERWGDEDGRYFTDPGTGFENLHLNVSQDKRTCNQYVVLRGFETIRGKIAGQPFDEPSNARQDEEYAIQYKSSMSAADLIEAGYIKRVEIDSEDRSGGTQCIR